ncbi:MAG: DUF192 domain-containing protein [Nitriliruptor sp.]
MTIAACSITRRLAAACLSAILLGACSGDGDDDGASTAGDPADDVPVSDTEPGDDGATRSATGEVPPLLAVVDGWPESVVEVGDDPLTFHVKVAAEPERRQQGLMNVEELPDGVGMLFLFDEPREGGFWMKDTLVPLDIAYVRGGEVVAVLQMDPCEEDPCPTYDPGVAYDAALEVNQGVLVDAEVDEGTTVSWSEPVETSS